MPIRSLMQHTAKEQTCRVPSASAAAAKCWLPASCTVGLPRRSLHSCCPLHEQAISHCALRWRPAPALLAAASNVTDLCPCVASSALSSAEDQHILASVQVHRLVYATLRTARLLGHLLHSCCPLDEHASSCCAHVHGTATDV